MRGPLNRGPLKIPTMVVHETAGRIIDITCPEDLWSDMAAEARVANERTFAVYSILLCYVVLCYMYNILLCVYIYIYIHICI